MGEAASSLETIRQSPQYQAAKERLGDRNWRIDNLYIIKGEDGLEIPFKRNEAQLYYSSREWYRDTILKSRKVGFSTLIAIEILDASMFGSNVVSGIIDRTVDDATSKLAIVKFAFDRMPKSLREANPLVRDNQSELVWANGSKVIAGTSYRGDTPQNLWVSEYGIISAKNPEAAKEIKTGSFKSVPKYGKIWVESTPMGTSGEFYDLVQAGQQLAASGQQLTEYDFKLSFFGWTQKASNRLPINLVHITPEMKEYFNELRIKHGIVTDGMQQAWYVKQREILGPSDILSEEPSTIDECFYASLEGSYFKTEMNQARKDGRVGKPVPYDSTRPVHTSVDLGNDENMFISFFQTDGVRHRFIDSARGENSGLSDFIRILKEKNATRGFVYAKHYSGHDMAHKDWSNMGGVTAQTRKEVAAEYGIDFIVVPRVGDKMDSIEAARRLINSSWFCSDHAQLLVECLDSYQKKWNKSTLQWAGEPAKNGFDHGADSYQNIAMMMQPDIVSRRDAFSSGKRKGSQWVT